MLNSKGGAMKVKVSSGCLLLMLGQVSRLIQFSSLLTRVRKSLARLLATALCPTSSFELMARGKQGNESAQAPSTIVPTVPSHPLPAIATIATLSYDQCATLLKGQ
jgi:hypothetical protein